MLDSLSLCQIDGAIIGASPNLLIPSSRCDIVQIIAKGFSIGGRTFDGLSSNPVLNSLPIAKVIWNC